eukprot:3516309-Amphidinium_carterae.1
MGFCGGALRTHCESPLAAYAQALAYPWQPHYHHQGCRQLEGWRRNLRPNAPAKGSWRMATFDR